MKKIIAGALLVLPLAVATIPTQASAFEVNINPRIDEPVRVELARSPRRGWVPGHYEGSGRHRRWIPGHYEYVYR